MLKYNIGDTVEFRTEYDAAKFGKIMSVVSEMDSYDEMRLDDGVAFYWSKKMKKWTPVKEKNAHTVFLEVKTKRGGYAFIFMDEVMEYEPTK
tara:strand:+ start:145 stop:420 length:276 start_codon:yes stop_codon:yes gene_type:complete